jgi:type IV pilus assembly protein PilC
MIKLKKYNNNYIFIPPSPFGRGLGWGLKTQKMKKIQNFFEKIKEKNKYWVKISQKNKIMFFEQLSNLINSWIPLMNAFKIMMYQSKDKKIKNLIKNILNLLNKWNSLKDVFQKYKKIFSPFDVSIVEMWEVTWKIWDSVEVIKIKEEKGEELKSKILWALIYPAVIIILSITMIAVFMIYVIPKIQKMYKDAKVNLPDLTQKVIDTSNFLQKNILSLILCFLFVVILLTFLKKYPKTKIYFDRFILHIPIFWWLIKKKILALFTSSLWILLENWIIINKSLDISSKALENKYYEQKLREIILWVNKWVELSTLMWINDIQTWKENFLFPIELASIVKIWEQTGKLPYLFTKISIKFNREVDNIVKNIQTIIEPLVIVFVWWIIWTLILAIMLPFFNMINVI